MIVLILLAFAGMLTGIFLILGMTPFTFAEELTKPLSGRRQPISKRIQQVNHPKEPKGIRKTVQEAREMLILTGKGGKFAAICAFSLFLAAMGAVICIVIQNYFMLPVLAAGMGLLPFWYVLFTSHSYKKLMNNEIETGLSIITSSYLRSESIITAVEENIHYLNRGRCVPWLFGRNRHDKRRCEAGPLQYEAQAGQLHLSGMGGCRYRLSG